MISAHLIVGIDASGPIPMVTSIEISSFDPDEYPVFAGNLLLGPSAQGRTYDEALRDLVNHLTGHEEWRWVFDFIRPPDFSWALG